MLNTIGQCLSVLASYSFPSKQGPYYTKGITLNIAFQSLGFCLAIAMTLYYRWENKRRDKLEGGPPAAGTVINTIEEHDLAVGAFSEWRLVVGSLILVITLQASATFLDSLSLLLSWPAACRKFKDVFSLVFLSDLYHV